MSESVTVRSRAKVPADLPWNFQEAVSLLAETMTTIYRASAQASFSVDKMILYTLASSQPALVTMDRDDIMRAVVELVLQGAHLGDLGPGCEGVLKSLAAIHYRATNPEAIHNRLCVDHMLMLTANHIQIIRPDIITRVESTPVSVALLLAIRQADGSEPDDNAPAITIGFNSAALFAACVSNAVGGVKGRMHRNGVKDQWARAVLHAASTFDMVQVDDRLAAFRDPGCEPPTEETPVRLIDIPQADLQTAPN